MKKKRKMRRLVSIMLTVVMIVSMSAVSFAATEVAKKDNGSFTITITNSSENATHTYEAYQIFKGDLASETTGSVTTYYLSNIEWGSGVNNGSALLTALQADTTYGSYFTNCSDAAGVAEVLSKNSSISGLAEAFAKYAGANLSSTVAGTSTETVSPYTITSLTAGYYLVKDKNNSVTGDSEAYTNYILEVVNNVNVTPKSDVPTSSKKVDDVNDSSGVTETNLDTADYDFGDNVKFTLTATLPSTYFSDYSTYKLIFHDTLSSGLSLNESSIEVYIGTTKVNSGYSVKTATNTSDPLTDGHTFDVIIDDVIILGATAGSKVTVTYTAELLNTAGYYETNKMYIEYSNNPNNESNTGTTPVDTVTVFTFSLTVNKLDSNSNALAGAQFTLYKKVAINAFESGVTYYTVSSDGTWSEVTELYDSSKEYFISKGVVTGTGTGSNVFTWKGLDDGYYVLVESTTPAGYNTINDIYFKIDAEHSENSSKTGELTKLTATETDSSWAAKSSSTQIFTAEIDSNKTEGTISTNVINNAGSVLPSTGGIGTTIFYVIGGILVIGAVVLLITKKRLGDAE